MSKNLSQIIYYGARLILGVVFIYASFDKILHPALFSKTVYNYQILPDGLINSTAVVLPWLELIMGIFFVIGFWMPGTVVLSNILIVSCLGALLFNVARGLDIRCGCFLTSPESSINVWYVLRDASFLLLSVYLFFVVFGPRSTNVSKQVKGNRLLN